MTEQVSHDHGKAGQEHVPASNEDYRATDDLVAGVQDYQPDDGPRRSEQVAEPDDEGPQSHVIDVLGVDMEESARTRSP